MEIIFIYVMIGILISATFFLVADYRPWYLIIGLCIVWLPLLFIGVVTAIFMDIKEISNKLNK